MLDKKFNEVIKSLEDNIKDKNDLEFARKKITELTMSYLDEMNQMERGYEKKIELCNLKLVELEERIETIEGEIYEEDEEDFVSILCPYCNSTLMIDSTNQEKEIECPDCHNMIELDWGLNEDDDIM